MKKLFLTTSILVGSAFGAVAGGVERSAQGVDIIFQDGGYVELSFGSVTPSVSGVYSVGGLPSGNMAATYTQFSLGVKQDISDKFGVALILDQPYGANVNYPVSAAPYPFAGTTAEITSTAITALGRYKVGERFSVHGGLRHQSFSASASIPVLGGYGLDIPSSSGLGYVVGAAYEIPDIALRVAVTYNSAISHTLLASETGGFTGTTSLDVETPQSVNLDFQSGVAADTLVFGSIRWVDWTSFSVTPPGYAGATGGSSLLSYSNDVTTYTLGVGRKFSDTFSGSVSVAYEESQGGFATNLAPTDGFFSVQLGGKYTMGNMNISGGVRYVFVGDAITGVTPTTTSSFTDNTAVGVGIKVGFSF
ncbi:MAG: hypothetical protein V3V25_00415 [Paracoccaceae bacterium]